MKQKVGKMLVIPIAMILLAAIVAFSTAQYSGEEEAKKAPTSQEAPDKELKPEEMESNIEQAMQQKVEEEMAQLQEMQKELAEVQKQQVLEQNEKRMIHVFTQEDMVITPQVPMYTYEEASALSTPTEYRDILPGASEGTWYVLEIDGIEYFYARYDFQSEAQPDLCGAGYVIVGDNYSLANGLKVGMAEDEVLELYPNMAVVDFEGNTVYGEVASTHGWNLGHYPQSETWLEDGTDYQWTDQFDYVMMGLIDQGDNTLPLYVGLMMKDKVVKAISFHNPTAG